MSMTVTYIDGDHTLAELMQLFPATQARPLPAPPRHEDCPRVVPVMRSGWRDAEPLRHKLAVAWCQRRGLPDHWPGESVLDEIADAR